MITVVGEALVGLVEIPGQPAYARHPGGSPANVAVGLARPGTAVALATQLGTDALGRIVHDHLVTSGVDVQLLPGTTTATSHAIATLDETKAASYDFRLAWDITAPPVLDAACRCLHTGSLATGLPPGAAIVEALLGAEHARGAVTISLDPNIRPSLLPSPDAPCRMLDRQIPLVDIVKVSEEDLAWLHPDVRPIDVAHRWLDPGPALVIVTHGGDGASAVTGAGTVDRLPPPVEVADTVGAGDAFTADLLDWLRRADLLGGHKRDRPRRLDRGALRDLLDAANLVAALTCARPGASPPTSAEVEAFIQASSAAPTPSGEPDQV